MAYAWDGDVEWRGWAAVVTWPAESTPITSSNLLTCAHAPLALPSWEFVPLSADFWSAADIGALLPGKAVPVGQSVPRRRTMPVAEADGLRALAGRPRALATLWAWACWAAG